ncbi:MAG TPA: 50S ribosomal protein L1 [Cytophagales bacterium]|nr:50S ribosomal protein L1 [Cytophagales bacterium]
MARLTKKKKDVLSKYDLEKEYTLQDAASMLKDITYTKFDSSVDIDVRLGVDPKKADQMVRGVAALPNGIGKEVKILVLCSPDKEQEARDAGAEYVGLDEYITKIEQGWLDIDVIITTPTVMAKVGKLGRVLGPRNLMPNPKSGTVTLEVGKAVKEIKAGKVDFKVDKTGIIHSTIGRASFTPEKIMENAQEILNVISKLKPTSAKGLYFKSIHLSTTMSPSITIDKNSVSGI